jgi:2'-5' RNA ligase
MRSFFAIQPPRDAAAEIVRLLDREARRLPSVRFIGPDRWHVTLRFLGDIDPERALVADRVGGEVARLHPPFEAGLASFGVFPDERRPKVLWLGVSDPDRGLHRLAEGLGAALRAEGFDLERRPFHPHLTLARIQGRVDAEEVRAWLRRAPAFSASPFAVTEFTLLESRGGAYVPLRAWPLTPATAR